jgi:hypothetical protein
MAEPFSAFASALQIADLGFSLASKLYQYGKDVQSSPVDIPAIALEIEVTSDVLRQTDAHLGDEGGQGGHGGVASDDAKRTARRTMEACRGTFGRIDEFFGSIVKTGASGGGGAVVVMSRTVRMSWPLKSGQLKTLLANLERHKTTLLLILAVLALKRGGGREDGYVVSCEGRWNVADF